MILPVSPCTHESSEHESLNALIILHIKFVPGSLHMLSFSNPNNSPALVLFFPCAF